jgi:hypothetical protein
MKSLGATFFALAVAGMAIGDEVLVTKTGERYVVKGSPRAKNGTLTFTTRNNVTFSVKESEIDHREAVPPPTTVPLSGSDAHAVGEIVRRQREDSGEKANVAPESPKPKEPAPANPKKPGKRRHKSTPPPPPPPPA